MQLKENILKFGVEWRGKNVRFSNGKQAISQKKWR